MVDPLTPDDAACLQMLAGANFGPNANLTLPSGRVLPPDEAQAFTSAYAPSGGEEAVVEPQRRRWRWSR